MTARSEGRDVDGKLERELLVQLKRLVKAQERIGDALDAANAADPLAMIQQSLEAGERATTPQGAPLDDETEFGDFRAYVAALG